MNTDTEFIFIKISIGTTMVPREVEDLDFTKLAPDLENVKKTEFSRLHPPGRAESVSSCQKWIPHKILHFLEPKNSSELLLSKKLRDFCEKSMEIQ